MFNLPVGIQVFNVQFSIFNDVKHLVNMKILLVLLLVTLVNFSCTQRNKELYSFEFEKILSAKNWEAIEIKNPEDKKLGPNQKPYDINKIYTPGIKYRYHIKKFRDSIIAIYDIENSGCLEIVPYSHIIRDTLILEYGFKNDGCKEDEVYRLKYVVKRNNNYRFIRFYGIVSEILK